MSLTNFEVDVLASGSKGNSTLIRAGQTAILIDAGISCRRIVQGLKRCGLEPEDLSGVFLTHEHRDHIAGLDVFARTMIRYRCSPVKRPGPSCLSGASCPGPRCG